MASAVANGFYFYIKTLGFALCLTQQEQEQEHRHHQSRRRRRRSHGDVRRQRTREVLLQEQEPSDNGVRS